MTTINLEHNKFLVHLDHGDLLVTLEAIEEVTQVPVPAQQCCTTTLDRLHVIDGYTLHRVGSWSQGENYVS